MAQYRLPPEISTRPYQYFMEGDDLSVTVARLNQAAKSLRLAYKIPRYHSDFNHFLPIIFKRHYGVPLEKILCHAVQKANGKDPNGCRRAFSCAVYFGCPTTIRQLMEMGLRPQGMDQEAETLLVMSKTLPHLRFFQRQGYDLKALSHLETFTADRHEGYVDLWRYMATHGDNPRQIENLVHVGVRQQTQKFYRSAILDAIDARNDKIFRAMMSFWPFSHDFNYTDSDLLSDVFYACRRSKQDKVYREMQPYVRSHSIHKYRP